MKTLKKYKKCEISNQIGKTKDQIFVHQCFKFNAAPEIVLFR